MFRLILLNKQYVGGWKYGIGKAKASPLPCVHGWPSLYTVAIFILCSAWAQPHTVLFIMQCTFGCCSYIYIHYVTQHKFMIAQLHVNILLCNIYLLFWIESRKCCISETQTPNTYIKPANNTTVCLVHNILRPLLQQLCHDGLVKKYDFWKIINE